jgi:ABC-type uncharacterized transport system ATPase component
MTTTTDLRHEETQVAIATLTEGQSLLVLGDDGGGKTTLAHNVAEELHAKGYMVAIDEAVIKALAKGMSKQPVDLNASVSNVFSILNILAND